MTTGFLKQPLFDGRGASKATVTFASPVPESNSWSCVVTMSGLPGKKKTIVKGCDPVHALALALEFARGIVKQRGRNLRLATGEPAELGFPAVVPTGHGVAFARRMEAMLEKEYIALQRRRLRAKAAARRGAPKRGRH